MNVLHGYTLSSHMNDRTTESDWTFTLHRHLHVSTHQLKSTMGSWSFWQSEELSSEQRISMESVASLTSAPVKTGWVRLRGWGMAGLSMRVLFDLSSGTLRFWLEADPGSPEHRAGFGSWLPRLWFRLDIHMVYHLFSFDTESLYLTAECFHLHPAWMCQSNLLQPQPGSRVIWCPLCLQMPGWSLLLWAKAQVSTLLPSIFIFIFIFLFPFCICIFALISLCLFSFLLPTSLNPSFFSLLCTDTLVKSAYYALRWPCIAFYIRHKAVNDTEKREHMKREEGEKKCSQRGEPCGFGSLWMWASRSHHQCHIIILIIYVLKQ